MSWITFNDFADKHCISRRNIHTIIAQGRLKVPTKGKGQSRLLDEEWILKRKQFQERVRIEAQRMFHETEDKIIRRHLARHLATVRGGTEKSWVQYMYRGLWSPHPESITNYRTPRNLLNFYRTLKHLLKDTE